MITNTMGHDGVHTGCPGDSEFLLNSEKCPLKSNIAISNTIRGNMQREASSSIPLPMCTALEVYAVRVVHQVAISSGVQLGPEPSNGHASWDHQ